MTWPLGGSVLLVVAGGVLLFLGRRLFWLLVGLVGFFAGSALAAELLPQQPGGGARVVVALVVGLLAAAAAVFFQKVALAVAGFLIGGYTALWFLGQAGVPGPPWSWLLALAAGVLGSLLARVVFDLAVILLSSVAGADLVVEGLAGAVPASGLVLLLLVGVGVVAQLTLLKRRRHP